MSKPIEIGDADAFEVRLPLPELRVRHDYPAKKAKDIEDKEVAAEDLEALGWVRAKKGWVDLGQPYTITRYSEALQTSYKDEVPARPVRVEVPVHYPGTISAATGSGKTLREAVESTKGAILALGPGVRTYPEFDEGLDRLLLKVGSAGLRVADLCALIRDYYEEHPTGGALHCSLDDGNMTGDVRWEVDYWRERNGVDDKEARLIGELLMLMSEDERKRLYERGYGR